MSGGRRQPNPPGLHVLRTLRIPAAGRSHTRCRRATGSDHDEARTSSHWGDATIEDVDLDQGEVHYHGERLTEERAEQLTKETLAELRNRNLIPGRKSLTGGAVHSPRVQFRVPKDIQAEALRRGEAEGKSISALAREALEEYLGKAS